MKKIAIITASVLALVLSASLFVIGVVATFKQSFGVKNTITFKGVGQNIIFILDGTVTGTNNDSNPNLTCHWDYEYDKPGAVDTVNWTIGKINFETSTLDLNYIHITYTFVIQNKGDVDFMVYFNGRDEIDPDFSVETTGTCEGNTQDPMNYPLEIPAHKTGTISLTVHPKVEKYDGTKACNFMVKIEELRND